MATSFALHDFSRSSSAVKPYHEEWNVPPKLTVSCAPNQAPDDNHMNTQKIFGPCFCPALYSVAGAQSHKPMVLHGCGAHVRLTGNG